MRRQEEDKAKRRRLCAKRKLQKHFVVDMQKAKKRPPETTPAPCSRGGRCAARATVGRTLSPTRALGALPGVVRAGAGMMRGRRVGRNTYVLVCDEKKQNLPAYFGLLDGVCRTTWETQLKFTSCPIRCVLLLHPCWPRAHALSLHCASYCGKRRRLFGGANSQVEAAHILVKWSGSRNPKSWK